MSKSVSAIEKDTDSDDGGAGTSASVSGPYVAWDRQMDSYRYWKCEQCGIESTDERLKRGCWRCGGE